MCEWKENILGPLCVKIGSGATPRGGSGVYLDEGEYALIRSQNVRDNYFDRNGLAYIENRHAKQLANVEVEENDVLLNITGDSVARCCQVDSGILPARVNQHVAIIRTDGSKLIPQFLRYYLISPLMKSRMLNLAAAGATRNALTKGMIEDFKIPLPSLPVQQRIAEILGSLDEKIELNRRTSATLEQMAQALFRSWFVDFDPVKVKAAGKRTKNLAPEITRLFPKEFEDSPLGPVPKGWKIRPLYDVATFINGAAFKNSHFSTEPDALPIIKIAEIKNGISPQTKFTKADLPEKYFIENGTILFSWSGSPETSIDTFVWTGGSGVLNQHIFRVDLLDQSDECFVYFLLKHLKSRFIEIAKNKQTTGLGHVTVQDMKKIMVPNPPPAVLDAYNEIAVPIFDKWYLLQNEINILSTLRDTLLPKLMSGEVSAES